MEIFIYVFIIYKREGGREREREERRGQSRKRRGEHTVPCVPKGRKCLRCFNNNELRVFFCKLAKSTEK